MATTVSRVRSETLRTLPDDNVRQILWRFADRYDLQMLVQSAREVARGPVARLVAQGLRGTHEWTAEKATLLEAFDQSGITAVFMDPEQGGYLAGPKNLALALTAFELAWVDAGAATCSLAGCLALAPIHERGTAEQQARYMSLAIPPVAGEDRQQLRGAFCLTEPIPYVGVDTGILNGKLRVEKWTDGEAPLLRVEKRGRFITNMGFANFVTAAVDSGDDRIKGSCIVIIEESDPGVFDRGTPTRKLVHQLSSTCDPIFNVTVPASRIVGGYTVKDGTIIPNYSHSEVIEAVFKRTRVTVALMSSAKLLSAIEPIIRYQRGRFRGSEQAKAGMLRYELGLQQRQDALHRLVSLWAVGEAGASLGFAAARLCDEMDILEREKNEILASKGVGRGRSELKFFRDVNKSAIELLRQEGQPPEKHVGGCYEDLKADPLVRFALKDAVSNVLCPACKLWNTGSGSAAMREALSLMGGYGITEDCPGFLDLQVDGHATGSHLRRSRGGAAAQPERHHDQRTLPGAVQALDSGYAPDRRASPRHRGMLAGHRDAVVAVDVRPSSGGDRRRWGRTVSERTPGRYFSTGRCTVLAAGCAAANARSDRVGNTRSGESGAG